MTLICAKFDADLINISKVTSRKTKWPSSLAYPVMFQARTGAWARISDLTQHLN